MSSSYPSLNFGLGEDIDMLRDATHQFAQSEIAPRAESIDKDMRFQWIYGAKWVTWGCLVLPLAKSLAAVIWAT